MDFSRFEKTLSNGWQTWHNSSLLSYVHIPQGVGFKLGIKDYPSEKYIDQALVGRPDECEITIRPHAHAYDASYTSLDAEFEGNLLKVETAYAEGDQFVLITPLKIPYVPSALAIIGTILWGKAGYVTRTEDSLTLISPGLQTGIFCTSSCINDPFLPVDAPHLTVLLSEKLGICTGKRRTLEEIENIVIAGQKQWEKHKELFGNHRETYNAMQTCLAWDMVYQPEWNVPITTVSRIWNQEWGGYVLFCWDTFFAALMQSVDHPELAYCTVLSALNIRTEEGFVPNFAIPYDCKSRDRSQPPVGSMVVWRIFEKYKDPWLLEQTFDALLGWNDWYYANRRTENGLMAWGAQNPYKPRIGQRFETSRVHCAQSAMWESGADDSPMYVDVPFDPKSNLLMQEDVALTSMMIEDCRCLAQIAQVLHRPKEQECMQERCQILEEKLELLWCDEIGLYLNRRTDTGAFSMRLSPFLFLALFSEKVSAEHAARMAKHYYNPEEFYGEYVMPSIARNDPLYPEQVYWRGRIWPPMNLLAYMAFHHAGMTEICHDLSEKSEKILLKEWTEKGHIHENYDPETGEGCGTIWSDAFYHWGGLMAWIALNENELC